MENPRIALVIPCYQPAVGWQELLTKRLAEVRAHLHEVVLVSDGNTGEMYAQLAAYAAEQDIRLRVFQQNRGKGAALREGIRAATADFTLYTDIDFPYTSASFQRVLTTLKHGADVVCGIRGTSYYTHLSPSRARLSRLFRWVLRNLFSLPIDDTQCGLKGMNTRGKEVFLQTRIDRYLFDLEFVYIAARKQLSIAVAEAELRSDVQLSPMRWKVLLQELSNLMRIFFQSNNH